MRYLRKQVLNRRAPFDTRFYLDASNGVVLANSNNLTLPKSNDTIVDPVQGMIRYNTQLEQYEGPEEDDKEYPITQVSTYTIVADLGSFGKTFVVLKTTAPASWHTPAQIVP